MDATWLRSRGKHQYEPAFQSEATDAAVLPDRRREEPRASPFASAQSCSLRFGDIGSIPARPLANHQMPRDVLRNGWLHRARGRALDPEDLRGVIGLSPSPRRTIGGLVGRFRRPNTWEDRIPAATSLSLAAGGWRCSKRLRSRCQRGVNSRYPLSCIRGD